MIEGQSQPPAAKMDSEIPRVETNFFLKPIFPGLARTNLSVEELECLEEQVPIEKKTYSYNEMNPGQKKIYDYVYKNPNNMIVIQGASGAGKTFTLKTIGQSWPTTVNAIMFRHDLLYEFRYIAVRTTVTKFYMNMFGMTFKEYTDFECLLSGELNSAEFVMAIINLLARAKMPNILDSLVILDEFTVVPKPMLLITLMLLKHYKIGTILSGNKHHLQNIHNSSEHMGTCSSFDIATFFVDKMFLLDHNEVCSNKEFNKVVEYMDSFSSDKWLDDFAYSLIAVVFHKQLFGSTKFTDTHIAHSHQALGEIAEKLSKEKHEFYYYHKDTLTRNSSEYYTGSLPLVIGSFYYAYVMEEHRRAELVSVKDDKIVMRFETGKLVTLSGLPVEAKGIYNFPIFPANFMTTHKCQGCKFNNLGRMDINLCGGSYQGMCVAISRVQDPSQIAKVSIRNPFPYLVSSIINFEELVNPDFFVTAELLQERMANYNYYWGVDLCFNNLLKRDIESLCDNFFASHNAEDRQRYRNHLLEKSSKLPKKQLNPPSPKVEDWKNKTVHKILKHKNLFLGLACIDEVDRCVWLKEFLTRTPEMKSLTQYNLPPIDESNILYDRAGLCNMPSLDCDTIEFITKRYKVDLKRYSTGVGSQELPQHDMQETTFERTPSSFLNNIYDKYNGRDDEITTKWLVDCLNEAIRKHGGRSTRGWILGKRLYQEGEDGLCEKKRKNRKESPPPPSRI